MTSHLGFIAEDDTDCDTLAILTRRVREENNKPPIGIQRRRDEGCAHIRSKSERWMRDLAKAGCSFVVIVHDLDRHPVGKTLNELGPLRRLLEDIPHPPEIQRLVCIPIEEIEAWFWSDDVTVRLVGRGKGSAVPNPATVVQPKEAFERLSKAENKKPRYSTNDNPKLAKKLTLSTCVSRCPEFRAFRDFLLAIP